MIKLSNGVELSEKTIVNALKQAGINVEPPKHIFRPGDIAHSPDFSDTWRLVVQIGGEFHSVSKNGIRQSTGQKEFENNNYEFVGKLKDLIK